MAICSSNGVRQCSARIALDKCTFETVSGEDWEAAAEGALRGEPLSSLHTTLLDGVEIAPLYTAHRLGTEANPSGLPGSAPFTRGATAASGAQGWQVRQIHDARLVSTPDAVAVDTTSGVDAVTVARGWDADGDAAALAAGIGDAAGAGVTIHLQSGASPAHAAALLDVFDRHGVDLAGLNSWLGLDPIAAAASGWHWADLSSCSTLVSSMCATARSAAEIAQRSPAAVPLEADGSVFADAGASDATELAAVLATGVAWLRAICDNADGPGLDPDAAARLLGFTLSAGPDPFMVTAKCRALRMCWTRVLGTCGVNGTGDEAPPMRLHAVSATAMLSAVDPWVNMLRATTASFGAANGGVDAITVRPFDAVSAGQASSGLGWRVAANTQLILRHESRIGSVIDPAGGSWYLEDLTRKLAQTAWDRFREIEATGGICAAIAGGELEASIATERAQRKEQIAAGEHVLVGVTDFVDSQAAQASGASVPAREPAGTPAVGLGVHRWAAPYEAEPAGEAVTGAAGS
ncbi:methylmalonyl-CoA mutase family protein [Candidatus Poriferisodalis sp.]|uniref:methylmalonyl-CoA mutase family protein n=1 Tax=Candidatus Poriferisodalis sp. TaxID=3101277 RepID=UPI003B58D6C1